MQFPIQIELTLPQHLGTLKILTELQHCDVFQVMTVDAAMFKCTNNSHIILIMFLPYILLLCR
jgi:hypothetical protein